MSEMHSAENGLPTGLDLIRDERQRQIDSEGWTPEHDAAHGSSRLLRAAEAYEWSDATLWPWDREWWKPKDAIRDLIRAGALYQAAADVSPEFDGAARGGVVRCAAKIDAALGTAHAILACPIPPGQARNDERPRPRR